MAEIEFAYPAPSYDATDERTTLRGWLDLHRATLVWKIEGLDADAVNRSIVDSGTSLCWLLKHSTHAEIHWFQQTFSAQEPEWPYSDPDVGYRLEEGQTVASLIATYQAVCGTNRQIEAAASSLDQISRAPRDDGHPTLRWIMTHMIEETARHNGHADIAREMIDGTTGS
jgi:uncharacterized damage-inducible protein DinB